MRVIILILFTTKAIELFRPDRLESDQITGIEQKLQEFTATLEYKMAEGFVTRFEYRRDWSNKPYFDRGNELASSKNMNTLEAGFMVFFGPKR